MRLSALALAALVLAAAPTGVRAQDYPWCAVYNAGDNAYNCGFTTYEQCQATIRGMGGFCERNTQFQSLRPYRR